MGIWLLLYKIGWHKQYSSTDFFYRKDHSRQAPPSLETVDGAIADGKSWSKRLKHHFITERKKTEPARKDRRKKKKKKKTKDNVYENSPSIQNSQQKEEDHVVHIYENAETDKTENDNDYEEPVKKISKDEDCEDSIKKMTTAQTYEEPTEISKDQDYEDPIKKMTTDQTNEEPTKKITYDQDLEDPVKMATDRAYEKPIAAKKSANDQEYEPLKITEDQDYEDYDPVAKVNWVLGKLCHGSIGRRLMTKQFTRLSSTFHRLLHW